ncbi:MAG: hypothetical protein EPO08_11450 [Rhodospirillaceae bacterium]|nr:MAG: hypothetical protein EPO08_11450 [Rhodospirillaceae bacterium]
MLEYSITDLFRLTTSELVKLDYEMASVLSWLPYESENYTIALLNQRLIRRELGRRDLERKFTPL